RVATYGQVARLAILPGQARLVGYALAALPEGSRVPWHRVINAQGRVSLRNDGSPMADVQRHLLMQEGVAFSRGGAVSLTRFRWRPREPGRVHRRRTGARAAPTAPKKRAKQRT
ncbi:MAG TPA: MGMT family protein, partial [Thermoanaerobaculia bacterium]|nr:MGMT family protein [Thermoanaerobaculia bacterium]